MTAAAAFLGRFWPHILVVVAVLGAYGLGDHNGATRVKNRVAAERAAANLNTVEKDAGSKEQAATERAADTANISDIERNQIDAISGATDDADIRLRAACQRLRASGRSEASLPEQCRSGR